MIDHTPFWYTFILACVILLRAIAPLSIAYTIYFLTTTTKTHPLLWPLQFWAIAETLFYGVFYLYRHHHLQSPTIHPALPSRDQRRALAQRCLDSIPDCDKYLSKWFYGAPVRDIKRENLKDFFRWAFLNTGTHDEAYDEELEEYVSDFEGRVERTIEWGRNESVRCYRLSIDNASILHRSLWWYFCVGVVDVITHVYMLFYGFRFHHRSWINAFTTFPMRPYTILGASKSAAPGLTYWHRPHTAKDKLPIVFIHGVGVGLYPNAKFLVEINQQRTHDSATGGAAEGKGDIGILAIELLHISSRIGRVSLDKDEFCAQFLAVLDRHGYEKFVLVAHSFGTFVTTQLLQHPGIAKRIESVIMIDPVAILLHLPDVATNFMIKQPRTANEWQLWYFGSRDAGVAHTFSRRFFWSESILWKEDIASRRATVFLGERDLLVDTAHVYEYLVGLKESGVSFDQNGEKRVENDGVAAKKLDVIMCPDMDHGQIFDTRKWRTRLIREVYSHVSVKKMNGNS